MPLELDARDAGFAAQFEALVNARREADEDVAQAVRDIVRRVRGEGDAALADLTARFDRFDLNAQGWSISAEQCAQAYAEIDAPLRDVVLEMTSVGKGVAGVVDQDGCLAGVITDGDLRRSIDQVLIAKAADVMTRTPITVPSGTNIEDVRALMVDSKITVIFVTDRDNDRRPIGVVHIHDLAAMS